MRSAPKIEPTSGCVPPCGNPIGSGSFSHCPLRRAARSRMPRASAAKRTPRPRNTPSWMSTPTVSPSLCAAPEPRRYCTGTPIALPSTPCKSTAAPARAACSAMGTSRAACCDGTTTAPSSSPCRGWPRMEPKYRVGQGDQLRLERRESFHSDLEHHTRPLGGTACEIQVNPVVARLGIVQTLKEVAQGGADVGRQGRKGYEEPARSE